MLKLTPDAKWTYRRARVNSGGRRARCSRSGVEPGIPARHCGGPELRHVGWDQIRAAHNETEFSVCVCVCVWQFVFVVKRSDGSRAGTNCCCAATPVAAATEQGQRGAGVEEEVSLGGIFQCRRNFVYYYYSLKDRINFMLVALKHAFSVKMIWHIKY